MEGILKKVNLTEELCEERSDIQGLWHDYVINDLETFNEMVEYLIKIKHQCRVESHGFHDVDRFYQE